MTIREKRKVWNEAVRFSASIVRGLKKNSPIFLDETDIEYIAAKIEHGIYKRLGGIREQKSRNRKRRTPKF